MPVSPKSDRRFGQIESALIVCLVSLFAGCHGMPHWSSLLRRHQIVEVVPPSEPTYSVFVSPLFEANRPRRVVMLEAGQSRGNYGETQKLIAELASQIRVSGIFEVVTPPNERLYTHPDNILQGKFDEREIAELSRRYNADAIALVRVNELRAYSPMRVSFTMAIVDSYESVVSFAIDGNWDTARQNTYNEFQAYLATTSNLSPGSCLNGAPPVQSQAPKYLFAFAASQIVGPLSGSSPGSTYDVASSTTIDCHPCGKVRTKLWGAWHR